MLPLPEYRERVRVRVFSGASHLNVHGGSRNRGPRRIGRSLLPPSFLHSDYTAAGVAGTAGAAPTLRLPFSAYSAAAFTKPRNSGCGRSGRLVSSGWACVPTKYGWSSGGSSRICMIGCVGCLPLKTMPCFSSIGMYLGSTS